jgi:hypothetical protein
MLRSLVLIALAPAVAGFVATAPASAATFEVSTCNAAPGFVNNSWRAEVTNPALITYNACPSSDNPRFGLGARGTLSRSRRSVPTGAATRWRFDAPPTTAIVGIRADALFEQYNSRWQVGLLSGSQRLVGCRATRSPTGGGCVGTMSAGDYVALPPSHLLYTEVYCVFGPCPLGVGGKVGARASMTFARVTIADGTAPTLANAGGDLWTSGWIRGTRQLSFDATDNTGIKEVRASVDGGVKSSARRECDPTLTTCPDWPGVSLTVPTGSDVPDGKHTLSLQAVDRADNVGDLTRDILIDNMPPAAPQGVAVSNGESWKSTPAFDVAWKNPPQAFAPIAGVEYTLCPAPPAADSCVPGSKDAASVETLGGLQVPQPGDWLLTTWLRDEAGNAASETAATPVHLRFDPTPPQVAIRQTDPEDPSRVHVDAADDLSGVSRVEIELRRQATEVWRHLDASPDPGGGFSAALHDERLRDGVYELRAHAWDAAGNERSSTQFASGAAAALTLPLRVETQLRVGKALRLRARRGRAARRHVRTIYVRRPLIRHDSRVRLHGKLVAPGGNPVQGAAIDVSARPDLSGSGFQPVATLTTSRTGRFTYLVPGGTSRVLRFDYAGAAKIRPQTREVEIRVRASSTIRSSRRSVVNGEAVTFSGRLRGRAIPPDGKLVELQYFDRGRWRTFRTTRAAAPDGRWRYAYRFDGTTGVRRYRLRMAIPRESGYPFAAGMSPTVPVTVRGL